MEFKKERVFTAVNADELKPGDRVIVGDSLTELKVKLSRGFEAETLTEILDEDWYGRFEIDEKNYYLAYLCERAENCTNCKFKNSMQSCRIKLSVNYRCKDYEPVEPKTTEKHLRPFKDTDELIKVWGEKGGKWQKRELTMPHIWVQEKESGEQSLITNFNKNGIKIDGVYVKTFEVLLGNYEFLDGSPCGVEE